MKLKNPASRLRIYIGEVAQWKGMPLYHAIVMKARERGLAGATVMRGIEGYGANSRIHTARTFVLSTDLPLVVEIVDNEEYINGFLPTVLDMVGDGLVTIEPVTVLKYARERYLAPEAGDAAGGGRVD